MSLQDFNSETEKLAETCEIVSPDGVDWTSCDCNVSEVYRFEEPVNEIDLIAHMREEHGYNFEDAKKQVRKYKEINEAIQ